MACAGKPPGGPVAAAATPSQDGSIAGAAQRAGTPEQRLQGAALQAPSLPPTPLSTGTCECPVCMLPGQQSCQLLLLAEPLLTSPCWEQRICRGCLRSCAEKDLLLKALQEASCMCAVQPRHQPHHLPRCRLSWPLPPRRLPRRLHPLRRHHPLAQVKTEQALCNDELHRSLCWPHVAGCTFCECFAVGMKP